MPQTFSRQIRAAAIKHLITKDADGRSNLDIVLDKLVEGNGDKYLALICKLIALDTTKKGQAEKLDQSLTDMIMNQKD